MPDDPLESRKRALLKRRNAFAKDYKEIAGDIPQLTGLLRDRSIKLSKELSSTIYDIDKFLGSEGVEL